MFKAASWLLDFSPKCSYLVFNSPSLSMIVRLFNLIAVWNTSLDNSNQDSHFRFVWIIIPLVLAAILQNSVLQNDFVELCPWLFIQNEWLVFMSVDHFLFWASCFLQHHFVKLPSQVCWLVHFSNWTHLGSTIPLFASKMWDIVISPLIHHYMSIVSQDRFFSIFSYLYVWLLRCQNNSSHSLSWLLHFHLI